jgi:hypothetical protein
VKVQTTWLSLDSGHTGVDRASLSSELFVNNGRQSWTSPTDLVQTCSWLIVESQARPTDRRM